MRIPPSEPTSREGEDPNVLSSRFCFFLLLFVSGNEVTYSYNLL